MGVFTIYDGIQDGAINKNTQDIANLQASIGSFDASTISTLNAALATATGNINTNTSNIVTLNSNIGIVTGSITLNVATVQTISNKSFLLSETMGTNQTASGIIELHTAGQTFAFGETGIYTSSGTVWKADANATGFFPADCVAVQAITAGNAGFFLKLGTIRDDSWNWTIGGLMYQSITIGAMTQSQPSATDDCIQILGKAYPNADTIQFNPQLVYISHT